MSITTKPARCPECGEPVPADAPQGLCPRCVLAGATAATPESPTAKAPELVPLTKVKAAFPQLEVLEQIGAGSMGAVFKARQPKLDRFVAIKILPQDLAADRGVGNPRST